MSAENSHQILIIDDDEIILMQLEQILVSAGYTAVCASNAKKAFDRGNIDQCSAIILDRRMPEIDGNEALIRLKTNKETKHIPVLMLTGEDRLSDISTSFELGAIDYIVKPFDKDNLLHRLQKAIDKTS
ncbi:MAG: hypothetical protein CMH26_04215 [Micavibrio sp.]|nr:hypothetical protein [Micavibrio sp.]|tara:strand:- start:35 stop:421 length:387 start_codon:yes stop_codon:yes gene_type:complete